ncbi:MAG: TIGR03790 family protein [Verrucomicrobiota bacterium]
MRTLLALLLLAAGLTAQASRPGEEVVVVYNSRLPESKSIAEHYARLRQVPTNQIFGFNLSTGIEMSRGEFTDHLQKPLAKLFEDRGFWHIGSTMVTASNGQRPRLEWTVKKARIRYVVLCYGVPVRIAENPALVEPELENVRPELRRNVAAVDSELALLPRIDQRLPLGGPLGNPTYARTNAAWFHPTNGVLMVARLDGPTPEIAGRLVDKAIEAETNGLWGRAYFDLRSITDPGYKPGDDMLRGAADIVRLWGFETMVDTNPATLPPEFPLSQIALYCGWYDANVSGPFTQPTVEFLPGAFAYHLHSYSGGNIRSATNLWVGPLLAKGATATMGMVEEPFLTGTPDLSVFLSRLTFFGFTFGEAAYASQGTLSWQTTVVGDPLYRPFAVAPQKLHEQLESRRSRWLDWSYLNLVDLNLAKGTPAVVMSAFLESLDLTRQSAVLSEKLADLYAVQGKPSSAVATYELALKLDASPQQRVRLHLLLADKLAGLERYADAGAALLELLREYPRYPDKVGLYQKLVALARKENNPENVARYSAILDQLTAVPAPATK